MVFAYCFPPFSMLSFLATLTAASVECPDFSLISPPPHVKERKWRASGSQNHPFFSSNLSINLPIRSATITGGSISFQNKMLKFNFKLLLGDGVPILMLPIYTGSCGFSFFFPSPLLSLELNWEWSFLLFYKRLEKGRRGGGSEGVSEWVLVCARLISLRTLHAFCLYWAQRPC